MKKFFLGFSLLEVLIAIGVLAVFIIGIFQIQSQSIQMVRKSKELSVATMLARSKLLDCKFQTIKNGFGATDTHEEGDFKDEGFKDYRWDCYSYQINVPLPSEEQVMQGVAMQQGEEAAGASSLTGSMLAPLFGVLNRLLNESIRELVVIVKWGGTGKQQDHIQVVTHLVNRDPLLELLRALPDQAPEQQQQQQQQGVGAPQASGSPDTKQPAGGVDEAKPKGRIPN